MSYLANVHRTARANPLLILCLASYCPYALNPKNQRDVDVVELKKTRVSRVWWFGSLEELWYLMIGPIQSPDEAKFADVEKAPSQNVATCRQNVATCRQNVATCRQTVET